MRVLLDERGVAYGAEDTASRLFDHLAAGDPPIVPRFMERVVLSPSTPRNRRGGHGAGAIAHDVPPEMAEAVVVSAAVAIS